MEDPNALVVPLDIILPIVELLTDRRDLNRCALVSRAFNGAATPHLYRTLDSRIRSTVSTCQVFVEDLIELRERERRGQRDAIRERIAGIVSTDSARAHGLHEWRLSEDGAS